jgi:AcrR family transcriptional regulator
VPDTRQRIVEAGAGLIRHQGYAATGMKQIATAAQAPFGSLYHFFPGGKEELGAEAIRLSGATYLDLIPAVFEPEPDLVAAVRAFFSGAADHLRATDYADACPIATAALEVSSSSEVLRGACADVFDSWITAASAHLESRGLTAAPARAVAVGIIAALEGAFVLCRALRTTEALAVAEELAVGAVERALADAGR